jgi:hypothetical protein
MMGWNRKERNIQRQGQDELKRAFARIKTRQLVAIAAALVCVLVPALIWKRPDVFGPFSKKALMLFQFIIMLLFVNFSAWNWKCPSCRRYLGNDIGRGTCGKCGTNLE